MAVREGVALAEKEIGEVFEKKVMPPETDTDDGFLGDEICPCPLCGGTIRRTKFGYGCSGYKEGCKFTVNRLLVTTGRTAKIQGFVSPRTGKAFDAALRLEGTQAKFDFAQ